MNSETANRGRATRGLLPTHIRHTEFARPGIIVRTDSAGSGKVPGSCLPVRISRALLARWAVSAKTKLFDLPQIPRALGIGHGKG